MSGGPVMLEVADPSLVYGILAAWAVGAPALGVWFWRRERYRLLAVACLALAFAFQCHQSATRFHALQLGADALEVHYLFGQPPVSLGREDIAAFTTRVPPWRGDTALVLQVALRSGRTLESIGGERPVVTYSARQASTWLGR